MIKFCVKAFCKEAEMIRTITGEWESIDDMAQSLQSDGYYVIWWSKED